MYAAAASRASASQAERIEARKTRMVWDIFPALGVGGGRKLEVAGKGGGGDSTLRLAHPAGPSMPRAAARAGRSGMPGSGGSVFKSAVRAKPDACTAGQQLDQLCDDGETIIV